MKYLLIEALWLFTIICAFKAFEVSSTDEFSENAAKEFLQSLDQEAKNAESKLAVAQLNFEYNQTDAARQQLVRNVAVIHH